MTKRRADAFEIGMVLAFFVALALGVWRISLLIVTHGGTIP